MNLNLTKQVRNVNVKVKMLLNLMKIICFNNSFFLFSFINNKKRLINLRDQHVYITNKEIIIDDHYDVTHFTQTYKR